MASIGRRGGAERYIVLSGGTGNPLVLAGTVDPSAAGGIVAPEGSVFLRYVATAGQIWVKTGAAATAWEQLDPDQALTREMLSEQWVQNDVAASQTDVDLSALVSTSFDTIKMIRDGSIVGLGTMLTEAITDATVDSLIVAVTINGTPGILQISHDSGTNPSGGAATQVPGIDTFVAGDTIGVSLTTLASFTPITTDVQALIEVSFNV